MSRRLAVILEPLEPRRLLSDGAPDPTFGNAGLRTIHFGQTTDATRGMALEPDGSIVLAGTVRDAAAGTVNVGIAKLTPAGKLDPSFAGAGKEVLGFNGFLVRIVALQPDGRILIGGTAGAGFALIRLNPDGTPDASFGAAGLALDPAQGATAVFGIVVQPSGDIVVAGGAALARFTPGGIVDPTFGSNGSTLVGFGPLRALAVDASGNLLAAGRDGGGGVVARFTPDGMFDPTFFAFTTFAPDAQNGRFTSLFVERGGDVIAAGDAQENGNDQTDQVIVRFNADGSNDASFGVDGVSIQSRAGIGGADKVNDVIAQADGKIVAAGSSFTPDGKNEFLLFRLNADGSLDTTFGGQGFTQSEFIPTAPANAKATVIALEPQGEVVAAGLEGGNFAVARYAAAFGTFQGSQLFVNGTGAADTIALSADTLAGTIGATLNGETENFTAADISRVIVFGYAGNDSITIGPSVPGSEIRGGPGADTLSGGANVDTLIGGGGADSILGGPAGASLRGGSGDDTLAAGAGSSTLFGGLGSDLMQGGPGDDLFLAVDNTPDTLIGGGGNDTASADAGIDQLSGINTVE